MNRLAHSQGIALAPAYDLLSTGVYHTMALAHGRADWPDVQMAIAMPDAQTFGAVTRASLISAGKVLGLPGNICERELDRIAHAVPQALDGLMQVIERENQNLPQSVQAFLAGELRLIRTVKYVVVPLMCSLVEKHS